MPSSFSVAHRSQGNVKNRSKMKNVVDISSDIKTDVDKSSLMAKTMMTSTFP